MALLGGYARGSGAALPRVVTISVTRAAGAHSNRYVVRLHEEGTPVAWRRDVALSAATAGAIAKDLVVLDDFSEGLIDAPSRAMKAAERIGRRLHATFLGTTGAQFLREHEPTALMIDADEMALDLPWELLGDEDGPFVERWPFGRLVTTVTRPKPERDPTDEDSTIAVLAVVDPSREFSDVDEELFALRRLGELGPFTLDVLERDHATSAALAEQVSQTAYDVVHFSAHGGFSKARPGQSGLLLADGPLLTSQILDLPWRKPPYLAIVSACWSGRSAADTRLTSARSGSNGVAAAFLASGASSCLGFAWPVHVGAAATFVDRFYGSLARNVNVGVAVLEARQSLLSTFDDHRDLAGLGAVFYGDVGTAQRRDMPMAEPPQPTEPDKPTRRDIAMAS
ncbi:MAG: CHAT domain-containing protein [Actinomycetes bacterium]